jgi:hypothetical protein
MASVTRKRGKIPLGVEGEGEEGNTNNRCPLFMSRFPV